MSVAPDYPTEWETLDVTCGEERDFTILDRNSRLLLNAARSAITSTIPDEERSRRLIMLAYRAINRAPIVTIPCPYTGRIEATIENGVARWTCPICDTGHETPRSGF